MFKQLEIKNIQSHKDTVLDFHPGVNVIVGSSDSGKTALQRAFLWLKDNRPMGTAHLSLWTKDKKGKLTEDASVKLTTQEGAVIVRERGPDNMNRYKINGSDYDAPKTDVPEEVTQILNLTEVNISRQHDTPFLIGASGAEVARFLNRVIRMDIIDEVLSNANTRARKMKQNIEALEKQTIQIKEGIKVYDWLPNADKLIHKLELLDERRTKNKDIIQILDDSIDRMREAQADLSGIDFEVVESLYSELLEIRTKRSEVEVQIEDLSSNIESHKRASTAIVRLDFDGAYSLLNQITDQHQKVNDANKEYNSLADSIEHYEDLRNTVEQMKTEINELEESMPETCPLCGALMKKEHEDANS